MAEKARRTEVMLVGLEAPLVGRVLRDWAIEAYAEAWGAKGPTSGNGALFRSPRSACTGRTSNGSSTPIGTALAT
jgi:hypothetical protein